MSMKPLGTHLIVEFTHCTRSILNNRKLLEQILKAAIKEVGLHCEKVVSHQFYPVGVTSVAIISESHISIHTYPETRHASIDIFTCTLNSQTNQQLLRLLKKKLKPRTVCCLEITRGNPIEVKQKSWVFESSLKGWGVRYHAKKVLLSTKTQYQQIDIIENDDFGRMLFLDRDLQVAEKDSHIYNQSLIAPLSTKRNNLRTVAILGGGDGGVLRELLKLKPQSVFLVEIDEGVIAYSKKFIPSISKKAFNNPKVKIVISDANKFLKDHDDFDAIILDLTMHPETFTQQPQTYYLRQIFSRIYDCLAKGGTLSLQCCSEFDYETLKLVKRNMTKYFKDITFTKSFIPSFCENWIFASARKV